MHIIKNRNKALVTLACLILSAASSASIYKNPGNVEFATKMINKHNLIAVTKQQFQGLNFFLSNNPNINKNLYKN